MKSAAGKLHYIRLSIHKAALEKREEGVRLEWLIHRSDCEIRGTRSSKEPIWHLEDSMFSKVTFCDLRSLHDLRLSRPVRHATRKEDGFTRPLRNGHALRSLRSRSAFGFKSQFGMSSMW